MKNDNLKFKIVFILIFFFALFGLAETSLAAAPTIDAVADESVSTGTTYTKQPIISNGATGITWRKIYGEDDLIVNSSTGAVSWTIPANLPRESFYIGVRACNADGCADETWIVKVGGGNYLYVGAGQTYSTISAATAAAASGDTIVVKAGIYLGVNNVMENWSNGGQGSMPPSGSPGIYTTTMADAPGSVFLDGQGVRQVISMNGNYDSRDGQAHNSYDTSYIAIKGFLAGRSNSSGPVFMNHVHHMKLTHVGAYDQATGDSGSVIGIARSGYILIENCFSYGNGREGIMNYISDYSIMRRNVVRIDRTNAQEPMGGIVNYATQHGKGQNNIVIDSDQINKYTYSYLAGAFCDSSGGARYETWAAVKDVITEYGIVLNVSNAMTVTTHIDNGSDPSKLQNMIGWDIESLSGYSHVTAQGSLNLNQVTFGNWTSYAQLSNDTVLNGYGTDSGSQQLMTNSIIYDMNKYGGSGAGLFSDWESANYNNIYDTGTINANNSTITNTITSNPQTSACLKYLPRLETGCSLLKAGLAGERVGAEVLYMKGKSGTMWGEAGYDTLTSTPMWPFPMEDVIKTKMAAYTGGGVNGARGFATGTSKDGSPQTLTKYIWEYLGNQIPADIYGGSTPEPDTIAPAAPSGLSVN